jgi:probable F420-dependent oxidoreductase
MRFGVSFWGDDAVGGLRDAARRAEELGYDVLLAADHLVEGCLPPLLALAVAAESTERIRLGTLVLNNDFWNPALLAREAAALDALSGGRFELGLGAGHMAAEYEGTGIAFEPAGARVSRLAASVSTIKETLAVTWPRPAAPLPLLVGGNGRRVHALAAREADIVGFVGATHRKGGAAVDLADFGPEALDRQVAWVREQAGDRFDELELNALVQHVEVTDDRHGAAARLAERYRIAADVVLASPYVCIGTVEQIADQLLAQRVRFGLTYYALFWPFAEAFAPVIDRLKRSSPPS